MADEYGSSTFDQVETIMDSKPAQFVRRILGDTGLLPYGSLPSELMVEPGGHSIAHSSADGLHRSFGGYFGDSVSTWDYAVSHSDGEINNGSASTATAADPLTRGSSSARVVPTSSYFAADLARQYAMPNSVAYQEALANTAHQREVRDLIAAGLNPVLSAGAGSGASVFGASEASGGGSATAKGNGLFSMLGTVIGAMTPNARVGMKALGAVGSYIDKTLGT